MKISKVFLFIINYRLKEQLLNQNNRGGGKSEELIRTLEKQLHEKMKQIKMKKEQLKKKGVYG